jgi:uncharacterized protein
MKAGLLVALVRDNDQYHDRAAEVAEQISGPVLTCEAVLAETAFHLQSSQEVIGMLRDNIVRVAFDCEREIEHLHDLGRYSNRHPDLAAVCLIRMSERYPRHHVVTTDQDDFGVYRGNKRETIPLLCPPQK